MGHPNNNFHQEHQLAIHQHLNQVCLFRVILKNSFVVEIEGPTSLMRCHINVKNDSTFKSFRYSIFWNYSGQTIAAPPHHQPNPPVNAIPTSAPNPSQATSPPNSANGSQPPQQPPAPQQAQPAGAPPQSMFDLNENQFFTILMKKNFFFS